MVTRYLLGRLVHTLVVLLGVATIVFGLTRVAGDPTAFLIPAEASREERALLRQQLGLDRPFHEQYAEYLSQLIRGDLGISFRQRVPAASIVVQRMPATIELVAASTAVALAVGLFFGILSAVKRGSLWDILGNVIALAGQSMPPFWTGIVAILVFSVLLGWLPSSGRGSPEHLVLPAITLGAALAGIIVRLVRASVLDVIGQDYVRTAYGKGLSWRLTFVRHVLKNAAIPIVTVVGLQLSGLLGGAIITETVFNYPGIGLTALRAILERDYPVVQAYVLVTATGVVALNLLVDLSYLYLDPRVRFR